MALVDIEVKVEGMEAVIAKLSSIPGGAPFAINHAIRDALMKARTQIAKAARERYMVPYGWVLQSVGRPIVAGMTGLLKVAGTKAPLSLFPNKDVRPGGSQVQELIAHYMTLRHAFVTGGGVMERMGAGSPRYPIRHMVGLSAPQMADEKTQVWPQVERLMQETLAERLEHYVAQLLSGGISL
jgi:hypothetical protein